MNTNIDTVIVRALRELSLHEKHIDSNKRDIIGIFNITASSATKRFHIYNTVSHNIINSYHVSHGSGSAASNKAYADKFSNTPMSKKSSLGAMKTAEIYTGKHGRSLRLIGLEKGINDNVYKRAIVIHAADYVTDDFIRRNLRAGCSWGCPAFSPTVINEVINYLKDGHFIYTYY